MAKSYSEMTPDERSEYTRQDIAAADARLKAKADGTYTEPARPRTIKQWATDTAGAAGTALKEGVERGARMVVDAAGNTLRPDAPIKILKDKEEETKRRVSQDQGEAPTPPAMRKGGKVKARGVGKALRGHGRGTMR
jgi:hypothetical protein